VISPSQRPLPDNTHNTHNRQTSMPPAEFEPPISAGQRLQTHALDRSATGIGSLLYRSHILICKLRAGIFVYSASCSVRTYTTKLSLCVCLHHALLFIPKQPNFVLTIRSILLESILSTSDSGQLYCMREPYRSCHGCSAACVIAQQYSFATPTKSKVYRCT
jgi:hypothetical protein